MQLRRVQQLQAATAERAEPVESAATSPLDTQEMAATADVVAPADREAVASRSHSTPMVQQVEMPVLAAPVEQVERQSLEQVELVATAAQVVQQALVAMVPQRVMAEPVEMARTVEPAGPVEAPAASTAMVAMVATLVTVGPVELVGLHQQTTSQPATVEPEATVEVQVVPAEQQDPVPVLPGQRERLGSVAMAE